MQTSPYFETQLAGLAERHGFSESAVRHLLNAIIAGNGSMAQFNHPELGGSGQWMRGGMTMIGDMPNDRLKARVVELGADLANLLASDPQLLEERRNGANAPMSGTGAWWPAELGQPTSSGAQNNTRYAYFAGPRRLVIQSGGQVTVHDTLDHQIIGFSQQQSGSGSMGFVSQHGALDLHQLPVVPPAGAERAGAAAADDNVHERAAPGHPPAAAPERTAQSGGERPSAVSEVKSTAIPLDKAQPATAAGAAPDHDALLATLEKLAALKDKGVLTEAEFTAKKAELLKRL